MAKLGPEKLKIRTLFINYFDNQCFHNPLFSHQKFDVKYTVTQHLKPVESTLKSLFLLIWSVKSIPGEKCFNFFTSPTFLHNLLHPGGNTELLIVSSEFFTFTPMGSDVNPVKLLHLWCVAVSRRVCGGNPQ